MVRSREVEESSIHATSSEGAGNNGALSAKGDFQPSPHPMTDETTLADRYDAGVEKAGVRAGDWIQTATGRQFWPMDPRPDEIHLEDVAHALSMLCRFTGHCRHFYSVAEHSVLLSHAVSRENALWALLHDATEAYLVDVPRPVKPFLPGYKEAEAVLEEAVARRFGLPLPVPQEVRDADRRILTDEATQNMAPPPVPWSTTTEPLGVRLRFWSPDIAKHHFLARFHALTLPTPEPSHD